MKFVAELRTPNHRKSWWWNEEVAKVKDEKRRLFKMWKKSQTEEARALYCIDKRNARI